MANKRYIRKQTLSFAFQRYLIQKNYPESKCVLEKNRLIWHGFVKPTPLSRTYNIKMICEKERRPKVILYGNNIEGLEKKDFPHHFGINKDKLEVTLCLHLPNEFNYSLRIIDTIIPWIQEWLYFYEIWLSTGKWLGGGHSLKKIK